MTRRINPKKIKNHGPPNIGDQKRLASDSLDLTIRHGSQSGLSWLHQRRYCSAPREPETDDPA